MSAVEPEHLNLSDFLISASYLHEFPLPKVKGYDFSQSFKGYLGNEETFKFIQSLSVLRNNMCKELMNYMSSYDSKLLVVDSYYPNVYKLLDSLSKQPPVEINRPFEFAWRGSLTVLEPLTAYSDLVYEVAMVLHTKAILHYNIAGELAKSTATITNSGQHLLTASSIMDYLATTLLPKWNERYDTLKSNRPPEVIETICSGLSFLFKSSASRMALCKAMIKEGGTAMSVLTKLAVAINQDAKQALDIIKSDPHAHGSTPKINPDILIYFRYNSDLSEVMIYAFHGKSFMDVNEFGKAIGNFSHALSVLSEQNNRRYDIMTFGFPKTIGPLSKVSHAIHGIIKAINDMKTSAKRDNDMIYFQDVPSQRDLPELPPPVFIMKLTPFDPTGLGHSEVHTFIHDPAKKGFFSSIFGSKDSTPTSPPNNPTEENVKDSATTGTQSTISTTTTTKSGNDTVETRQRSDSEIARDFQRRINMGEDL